MSRLGVRGRILLAFGALALIPSVVLAAGVWLLATTFLADQREATALAQARLNAEAVHRALEAAAEPGTRLLASLPEADVTSLVVRDGRWDASVLGVGPGTLPAAMRDAVVGGATREQRVVVDGRERLAVGVPLPDVHGAYFGLFSLDELHDTYRILSVVLAAAAAVTAVLGIVAGQLASRRALRPLAEITAAAGAVARGDLDVRLPATSDRHLAALAASFNETADALRRRAMADARFAGDVSHELRTPLTTMVNSVQLLQNRRADLPEGSREIVDLLGDDLARFRRMVTDLLEISRDDSGVGEVVREQVRVGELVRRAADGAAGRPVTSVAPAACRICAEVDKRRLARVVVNLVENAEQHGDGVVAVTVDVVADALRIVVDDNGPGVPPDLRQRIFERFARFQADPGTGVGLGLAIVERHVRRLGGSVRVLERPGGGARFVVDLPSWGRRVPAPRGAMTGVAARA